MIEHGIVAYLKTLDAVTAIVGTGAAARIRPDKLAEDDTLPALLVGIEMEEIQNDLDGETGLVKATFLIVAIAEEKADARALAEAVRINGTDPGTGLSGYSGDAGDYSINALLQSNEIDFATSDDGSDEGWFFVRSEYTVWYDQTT